MSSHLRVTDKRRSKLDLPNSRGKINIRERTPSPSSWEEVGTWTTGAGGLDIKDIVWPGGSHVPPEGVPEKFHVKIR